MSTVKLDLIKDSSATETFQNFALNRLAYISGITASNSYDYIIQAFSASGLPEIGDAHPSALAAAENVVCHQRTYKPTGNNSTAIIELLYKKNVLTAEGQTVYEFGTNMISEETNLDANGNLMSVTKQAEGALTSAILEYCTANVLKPQSILRATRMEYGSLNINAAKYPGAVNNANWAGGARRTWLCSAINCISEDGGRSYKTSYEFTYNPNGWVARVFYKTSYGKIMKSTADDYALVADPFSNDANKLSGDGWHIYFPYSELNFSSTFGNP